MLQGLASFDAPGPSSPTPSPTLVKKEKAKPAARNAQNVTNKAEAPSPMEVEIIGFPKRADSFTDEEDKHLCSCWKMESEDSIVGVDQKRESFWNSIARAYNSNAPVEQRSASSLRQSWRAIHRATIKFMGHLQCGRKSLPSESEQERVVGLAMDYFRDPKHTPFKFQHCF